MYFNFVLYKVNYNMLWNLSRMVYFIVFYSFKVYRGGLKRLKFNFFFSILVIVVFI